MTIKSSQFTRAAAYVRVSTEEQTEFSPDAQLRAIKGYCSAKGVALIENHIYRDDGAIIKLNLFI